MAASTAITLKGLNPAANQAFVIYGVEGARRRRVSKEAAHALTILKHAIEYLIDESIYDCEQFRLADPRIRAALILMERNQEIYFACPPLTMSERVLQWLHLSAA